jgi:hypothetical protein
MRQYLAALAGLFLLLPAGAFAQRTFNADGTKSTATPIIITESVGQNYHSEKVPEKPATGPKTSIKLNPLLILSGDMPVYLEHKIAEKITFEVSAGMTYDNFLTVFDPEHYPEDITSRNEMGYSFAGGLRYYPSDAYTTMEGYYFAPEFRRRVYKSTVTQVQGIKINPVHQQRTVTDMKLIFGFVHYFEDHIFLDSYIGIGMRNKDYENLVRSGANLYNGQTFEQTYDTWDDSIAKPILALGCKVGFTF